MTTILLLISLLYATLTIWHPWMSFIIEFKPCVYSNVYKNICIYIPMCINICVYTYVYKHMCIPIDIYRDRN